MANGAVREEAKNFIKLIEDLEVEQKSIEKSRQALLKEIEKLSKKANDNKEALDIATHAIDILTGLSDKAVNNAYEFLEKNLNSALARMFPNTTRQIKIKEFTLRNQYPQLELELHVGNGIVRSLKSDSGHGIAQIVSILCILALIVITGSRRLVVMDEVLSGVSVKNRRIIDDILWSFTEIGFQFLIVEHGYIPRGSYVYNLEMKGDVSGVSKEYLVSDGVYIQDEDRQSKDETYIDEDYLNAEVKAPDMEIMKPIVTALGMNGVISSDSEILDI